MRCKHYLTGAMNMDNNNFGQKLAKQTLDQIPQANANAKRIVGLVKESGGISFPIIPL